MKVSAILEHFLSRASWLDRKTTVGGLISCIGISTGCCCKIATFIDMGCDCSVICDDGSWYWSNIQRAQDLDHVVIRVHHGTSEEPRMVTLTKHVNENLPGPRAELLPHACTFHRVGA